jgi:hypothetical protein
MGQSIGLRLPLLDFVRECAEVLLPLDATARILVAFAFLDLPTEVSEIQRVSWCLDHLV